MIRTIHLLPQAVEDLDQIYDPLFSRLIEKIQLLQEFPSLGPALYGPFAGYRGLIVDLFLVIYQLPSESRIEIAYIRHVKRQR